MGRHDVFIKLYRIPHIHRVN